MCRDETGFDAEKFIEDSIVKIRSEDVRCECTPKHTKWKSQSLCKLLRQKE